MWGAKPPTPPMLFARPPTLFAAASGSEVPKDALLSWVVTTRPFLESLGVLCTKGTISIFAGGSGKRVGRYFVRGRFSTCLTHGGVGAPAPTPSGGWAGKGVSTHKNAYCLSEGSAARRSRERVMTVHTPRWEQASVRSRRERDPCGEHSRRFGRGRSCRRRSNGFGDAKNTCRRPTLPAASRRIP